MLFQSKIRPSALVVLLNTMFGMAVQIRLTEISGAGRPVVVSRTWQVIGSLTGVVILFGGYEVVGFGRGRMRLDPVQSLWARGR